MPKAIFFFLGAWMAAQGAHANDFRLLPASQSENYQENTKMALMASDYDCTDELAQNPDANSAIAYRAALEIIAKSKTLKEKTEEKARQSYFSTSGEDAPEDAAGRLWVDYAPDSKSVTGFSLLLNESGADISELAVHTLGKFNCEAR